MLAFVRGEAQARDVVALTKFFDEEIVRAFKEPLGDLDREFRSHLTFVFNQILQAVRKEGLSEAALENIGKLLFRLWKVFEAYKAKKERYTLAEWIEKVASLGRELGNAFSG